MTVGTFYALCQITAKVRSCWLWGSVCPSSEVLWAHKMCRNLIDWRRRIHQFSKNFDGNPWIKRWIGVWSHRHSGQVISNGDGLHPVKILDDLHAKSVKKFQGQKMCPYRREGKGMLNLLRFDAGLPEMNKSRRNYRGKCLACDLNWFWMKSTDARNDFKKHQESDWRE